MGDPALGVVNKYAPQVPAEDDHTNIVELKNGDSLTDIARSVLAIVGGDKATASRGVRSDTAVDTGISFGAGMCG